MLVKIFHQLFRLMSKFLLLFPIFYLLFCFEYSINWVTFFFHVLLLEGLKCLTKSFESFLKLFL